MFKGTLVRTADSIDLASRTLLTEVDVDNPTGELLPGAFTQVHLKIPSGAPSVIIPVTALIFRAQGLQAAVVNDGKHADIRNITLGRDYGSEVEVVSGLSAQDHVMVNPPDSLVKGEEVRITQQTDKTSAPGSEQESRETSGQY